MAAATVATILPLPPTIRRLVTREPELPMFGKRLLTALFALTLTGGVAACADNAEDHLEEAADEAAEGDVEDAAEERQEAQRDLQQGDTTELVN